VKVDRVRKTMVLYFYLFFPQTLVTKIHSTNVSSKDDYNLIVQVQLSSSNSKRNRKLTCTYFASRLQIKTHRKHQIALPKLPNIYLLCTRPLLNSTSFNLFLPTS